MKRVKMILVVLVLLVVAFYIIAEKRRYANSLLLENAILQVDIWECEAGSLAEKELVLSFKKTLLERTQADTMENQVAIETIQKEMAHVKRKKIGVLKKHAEAEETLARARSLQ